MSDGQRGRISRHHTVHLVRRDRCCLTVRGGGSADITRSTSSGGPLVSDGQRGRISRHHTVHLIRRDRWCLTVRGGGSADITRSTSSGGTAGV